MDDEQVVAEIDELIKLTVSDIQQCRENVKAFNECSNMDLRHLAKFSKESIAISQQQLKDLTELRKRYKND